MIFDRAAPLAAGLAACAAAPAAPPHPDVTGVWSGYLTTQDDPHWRAEDVLCFPGCPKVFRDTLRAAIDDPANAGKPAGDLLPVALGAAAADLQRRSTPEGLRRLAASTSTETLDLGAFCDPYGFVRESMNALPIAIREEGGNLVIQYEEWSLSRTIYMDGRSHPAGLAPTPLGHSVGRWEGDELVVDTAGIAGDYYAGVNATSHMGGFADGASAVERYRVEENPRRLVAELTLTDPVTLNEPYVWAKTWLSTPDVELVQDSCEETPGEFAGRITP